MSDDEPIPGALRMVCPACGGDGATVRERGAANLSNDHTVTVFIPERCRGCGGTRWVPGMRPLS